MANQRAFASRTTKGKVSRRAASGGNECGNFLGAESYVMHGLVAALVLANCFFAISAHGQTARPLGAPAGEAPEPFSTVTGLLELANGRVLVTDATEKTFQVIDFERQTAAPVSRIGDGPGEYQTPGRLFRWLGDSIAMYDPAASRVIVLTAAGNVVRSIQMDRLLSWTEERPSRGDVRFIDRLGRVYSQSTAIPIAQPSRPAPDSGPVIRHDPGRARVDTLTSVKLSGLAQTPLATGGFGLALGALANPFRTQDAWVGLPDGGLVLVRARPYQVEWMDQQGRVTRGPPVSYTPVPVTAADRAAIERQGVLLGGRFVPLPPDALNDLPRLKPAFDYRTVVADPTNMVWVQQFRRAEDTIPVYSVFDATGTPVARVPVPIHSRVVAVSARYVYLARTDGDGLQWLRRYHRSRP